MHTPTTKPAAAAAAAAALVLSACAGTDTGGTRGATATPAAQAASATAMPAAGSASPHTSAANKAVLTELDFGDRRSYEAVSRGFIARLPDPVIRDKAGNVVYDSTRFDFIKGAAPDTANPSLWRQSELNKERGLYKIADRIYQFRGYDTANMTLVQGKTGWIVIDTTTSAEVAAAGLKLANDKVGYRPVKAVIFTHSHADHFGGIDGVVSPEDIKAKRVQIIAPAGFVEEAVSENLYAGNAMARRARFSYSDGIPVGPAGAIGTGLGVAVSQGSVGLAIPTHTITKTGQTLTIDGTKVVFQNAPGTEAPSEMMFYFPELKALCLSEDATYLMHNLYTLRGAKVRSPHVWAAALSETLELFGDQAEIAFASHSWPTWGNANIRKFVSDQRDMYKFINDQTLRLANQGYNAAEIAERLKLPGSIGKPFYNRGYYGSLKHNVRATYQLYLGFFDGNPATLDALPRTESARRYVEAMGGADNVLKLGRAAFDQGDYRWTAELVNYAVYADPANRQARELQAAALEQMGFQAESATWRGFYLMGAEELRSGKPYPAKPLVDPRGIPVPMAVDYASTLVNPERAAGLTKRIGLNVSDERAKYTLSLENSVLVLSKPSANDKLDGTLTMTAPQFGAVIGRQAKVSDLVSAGGVKSSGSGAEALDAIAGLLDAADLAFPLVTPVQRK